MSPVCSDESSRPSLVAQRQFRSILALFIYSAAPAVLAGRLPGQGTTTASIAGRILDGAGIGAPGIEVVVTNAATGIAIRAMSRAEGRYLVSGLEVGGPYLVTARRIGFPQQSRGGLFLSLGQELHVDLTLEGQPLLLQGVETRAEQDRLFSRAHMGAEAFLGDSLIHRLPVSNGNLYDLVRLVPQTSTWFDLSTSGAGQRANSFRIDGVSDQVITSNLPAGALYGGTVVPLDAVKEYQVLLSPYDVRHGSFAGASINAVTRSGTNDWHGSVTAHATSERLGANVPLIRGTPYRMEQLGLSLGGPIVTDRLLFFASTALQRREIPAIGPYIGQSSANGTPLPVSATDVARFQQLLRAHGLDGGSAGAVINPNPSSITFLRLDAPIPRWSSRATLRMTYGYADSSIFARPTMLAPTDCPPSACFPLSSLQHSRWVDKRSTAAQVVTNFPNGAYNELIAGYIGLVSGFRPTVEQPLILVTVPGVSGAPAVLQSGTHEIASGQRNASWTTEVTDNLSISARAHRVTMGASVQRFDLRAFQLRGSYGIWEFASLDSFQVGSASRYRVTRDTGSTTAASGGYVAAYVGDDWDVSSRLSLTFGLRADVPTLRARVVYVPAVDSAFGMRTDKVPSARAQWSPRFGFNYDLTSAGGSLRRLRGGVGLFTGRPPLFWLVGGFAAYGLAARTLQCGSLAGDAGPAPAFRPDAENPPMACAGGQSFAASTKGEIDVLDPRLRPPQTLRASLAFDGALPLGVVGTVEGLYTRATRAVFFSSINLAEPVSSGIDGRLMYGSVGVTGLASPRRIASQFGDVIAVGTQSRDYAYDVTAELRRNGRVGDLAASVSVGKARDVATPRPVSALLADDWRFARPVAGREDNFALGTSDFDQPMRVRASGTLHSPWVRLRTDLSFFYIGGSGFPYTYVAGGAPGLGDLNADGAVGNDPIYIPRSAFDTTEIRFGGSPADVQSQQAAFQHFVDGAACLRRQRGRIMSRNSCRTPWMSRMNVALRQAVPGAPPSLSAEVEVFNALNLLNPRWGHLQTPTGAALSSTNQVPLLSQVSQTTGPQAQPVYRFDTAIRRYSSDTFDSYYQIQLAVRYTF